MNNTVCVAASTLGFQQAGGHMWYFLNWALGLKAAGCEVTWLELAAPDTSREELNRRVEGLKSRLAPFGLEERIGLLPQKGHSPVPAIASTLDTETILGADLLLNFAGKVEAATVARFRRSAFVDIDPGLTQVWISESRQPIGPHDLYLSIGETVGAPESRFPDCGVEWIHTPHPVHLPEWSPVDTAVGSPYTTVSSWWGWWEEFAGETFNNEKRTSFLEYLDLPRRTSARLELALALWDEHDQDDRRLLESSGWGVKDAFQVTGTPCEYRKYVEQSRGEFSCAKPSCMRLENAWLSDRTLCYMALGKPAIVQYTGPSRTLPEAEGLFRFRSLEEAALALEKAECDYQFHGRRARAYVEEHHDAVKVVRAVLERALC